MKIQDTDTYPLNVIMDAMKDVPDFDADRIYFQGINDALNKLSTREVFILKKRYAEGKTLKAIGEDCGISNTRIAQILNRSLRRLREPSFSMLYTAVSKASLNEASKALHGLQRQYDQLTQDYETLKSQQLNLVGLLMQSDESIRLQVPLETLDLPLRTHNTLLDAGICTVGDLIRLSKADLKEIKRISIRSINEALHKHGLFLFGDCEE